jgi:hypothetical protein
MIPLTQIKVINISGKNKIYTFTMNAIIILTIRRTVANIKYEGKKQFNF